MIVMDRHPAQENLKAFIVMYIDFYYCTIKTSGTTQQIKETGGGGGGGEGFILRHT